MSYLEKILIDDVKKQINIIRLINKNNLFVLIDDKVIVLFTPFIQCLFRAPFELMTVLLLSFCIFTGTVDSKWRRKCNVSLVNTYSSPDSGVPKLLLTTQIHFASSKHLHLKKSFLSFKRRI